MNYYQRYIIQYNYRFKRIFCQTIGGSYNSIKGTTFDSDISITNIIQVFYSLNYIENVFDDPILKIDSVATLLFTNNNLNDNFLIWEQSMTLVLWYTNKR